MSPVTRCLVRPDTYRDSVVLMRVAAELEQMPSVVRAALMMATPSNRALLAEAGLLDGDAVAAGPGDLVIAVTAADARVAGDALASAARLSTKPPRRRRQPPDGHGAAHDRRGGGARRRESGHDLDATPALERRLLRLAPSNLRGRKIESSHGRRRPTAAREASPVGSAGPCLGPADENRPSDNLARYVARRAEGANEAVGLFSASCPAANHGGAVDAQALLHAGRIAGVVLAAVQQDLDLVVAREGAHEMTVEIGLVLGDEDEPLSGVADGGMGTLPRALGAGRRQESGSTWDSVSGTPSPSRMDSAQPPQYVADLSEYAHAEQHAVPHLMHLRSSALDESIRLPH